MPCCCVPNCRSGYPGEPKRRTFSVPKGPPDFLKQWQRSIPREGVKPGDRICELHFRDDEVVKQFQVLVDKNGDNETFKLERDKAYLKEGAVPSIFPNCPKYLTKKCTMKRKSPKKRSISVISKTKSNVKKSRKKIFDTDSENNPPSTSEENILMDIEQSTYTLEDEFSARQLQLPPGWHNFYAAEDRTLIFLHWDGAKLGVDKKIIIKESHEVEVIIGRILLPIAGYKKIEPNNLQALLEIVHQIHPCKNADYNFSFLFPNQFSRKERTLPKKKVAANRVKKLTTVLRTQKKCAQTNKDTLDREIANLCPEQQENIRAILMASKRFKGSLVIDEMSLTPNLRFDKHQMKIIGFTDLGEYTPLDQKNSEGDHALVLLFQPFVGKWIQAVGAYLSKGCARADPLNHILLEAIALLEQSNFYVDAIVTDGANWNRGVWRLNGVDDENCSCTHPCDETRQLYFVSDFPHIIKNIRNWILKQESFWTPDGVVYLSHWKKIVEIQGVDGIHYCPRLTRSHIYPKQYQKMNVPLAYQFFGEEIPAALESLKNIFQDLIEGTCQFVSRMNDLIKAMNSRSGKGALRMDSDEYKVISSFIDYLILWKTRSPGQFITENSFKGLIVTLKSTLGVFHYLITEFKLSFFMTVKLNQDCLEHFFGLVRAGGGNNDHPDAVMFIYIFRLLCVYSLVQPPKGSNVENNYMVENFLKSSDVQSKDDKEKLDHWKFTLDRIIDNGDSLEDVIFEPLATNDAMQLFAGYVFKKIKKFVQCSSCLTTVLGEKSDRGIYFKIRDKYGVLHTPSNQLWALLQILENYVAEERDEGGMNCDMFFNIAYRIQEGDRKIILVGCEQHQAELTAKIVQYYITVRLFFLCSFVNRERKFGVKSKNLRKMSRLTK
ncbi:uncharacterized protein LOC135839982 isoform X2 [Planococcus citri]|uniref:uncharacterized protein LOC135839982 isoform X2 n=1 Tax=Planococcus citri TaxID=170843 RepID=UPI0031F86F9C